ncbi:sulfurtransferase TusA family protein [Pseudogracilibacillus sp. SE30717A]|uniref:sulfurtransferase TusA family protein n=1 Tax=Pseudogracilibacillus sp. SE30717A TaxID=3098293 RepID=UPI00300E3896
MKIAKIVDAKRLACPMPIVRTKKAIEEIKSGELLEVHTTDKGSKSDITAWAESGGHNLLESKEVDGVFIFRIIKG